MNTKQLEQLLLLEQSGELSPPQRQALQTEIAASEPARQLRAELRGLGHTLPDPASGPAPDAAAQIAARLSPAPTARVAFWPAWKPVLAAAAALALLFGVRAFHPRSPALTQAPARSVAVEEESWSDPLEAEFTELENLLAALSADDAFEISEL